MMQFKATEYLCEYKDFRMIVIEGPFGKWYAGCGLEGASFHMFKDVFEDANTAMNKCKTYVLDFEEFTKDLL